MNKNVGIITQARMGSTRLPGKVMLKINSKPILEYHIERLKKSGLPIYIATTENLADDVIEKYAKDNGLEFYRGSENNVLSRYYNLAKEKKLDVIIRVTSDSPFMDGAIIKKALKDYLGFESDDIHYSNCIERTYPLGSNFEIFSFKLLEEAYKNADTDFEKEHVTPYIIQNKSGNVKFKHFTRDGDASSIRITLDTPEDFELIKILIEKYDADKKSIEEVIKIYGEHPELLEINVPKKAHVWGDGSLQK